MSMLLNQPFLSKLTMKGRGSQKMSKILYTVKLLKRLAGLILFLKLKMRVLLEIGLFYLWKLGIIAGLIRIRVLLEGEPY